MPLMDWRHRLARPVTEPVARALARTPISPDAISWLGFVVVTGAAVLIVLQHNVWAGVVVLAGSGLDAFDGALARAAHRESRFGAVLDSTLDRLSEGIIMLCLISVFARQSNSTGVWLGGAALLSSYMVSYIRARAEGAGVTCAEGWFTRTERILVLALGLLTGYLIVALAVIAGLSFITACQRLLTVWRKIRS
jgi:CDP-diacylglycerol---glycerol-3-phosphate 3-phosphatidyltransferase